MHPCPCPVSTTATLSVSFLSPHRGQPAQPAGWGCAWVHASHLGRAQPNATASDGGIAGEEAMLPNPSRISSVLHTPQHKRGQQQTGLARPHKPAGYHRGVTGSETIIDGSQARRAAGRYPFGPLPTRKSKQRVDGQRGCQRTVGQHKPLAFWQLPSGQRTRLLDALADPSTFLSLWTREV